MVAPDTSAARPTFGSGGEKGTSTVVTAEIPAVSAGRNYGVLLPDGTIWYPGSKKRLPAPLLLRIVVWALAFLVLIAAVGDFIVRTHPAWVDPLRHRVPAAVRTPLLSTGNSSSSANPSSSTPTQSSTPASTTAAVAVENPQPAGLPPKTTAYSVTGTSSYQITVKTTQPTYVQAYDNPNGVHTGPPLYAGDVAAGATQTIVANGPVDLQIDAGGATITLLSSGNLIGTVAPPSIVPWDFWFQPASNS
ncbi:MAG: hypothetical protein ACYDGN_12480 [Acidimicrobiales bacterium]